MIQSQALQKIRVLVSAYDSERGRRIKELLSYDLALEVVAVGLDAYQTRDLIVYERPHVVVIDLQMHGLDGLTFIRRVLSQYPIPMIVTSESQADAPKLLESLGYGVVDFVNMWDSQYSFSERAADLNRKVRIAATVDLSVGPGLKQVNHEIREDIEFHPNKVAVIGASTGGPEAVKAVVQSLPANFIPIVVVVHMPKEFTRDFAHQLDRVSQLRVKQAIPGEMLEPGHVYVAPGGVHSKLTKSDAGQCRIHISGHELINGHCPAVDVMFSSAAKVLETDAIGLLLTGMGKDGARGLKDVLDMGGETLAQDEHSSVVYGMPKEALKLGAVRKPLPLSKIPNALIKKAKR